MKSSYKALDNVLVKDDFYAQPDEVRKLALSKTYNEPPADTPRLAVTAICDQNEARAMGELLQPYVPHDPNDNIVSINILFQAGTQAAVDYHGGIRQCAGH